MWQVQHYNPVSQVLFPHSTDGEMNVQGKKFDEII
jgi:hypothetical protein